MVDLNLVMGLCGDINNVICIMVHLKIKDKMDNFDLKKYLAEGKLLKEEENLEGKTINLVRTLHTTGKYNNETGKMDKVTQTKNMTGTIGDINSFSGSTGFWLMNDEGKKLGYVMYDPKIDKFIEGESSFYYEYEGQSSEDQELLNQFKG